jgi:hypothetical protein
MQYNAGSNAFGGVPGSSWDGTVVTFPAVTAKNITAVDSVDGLSGRLWSQNVSTGTGAYSAVVLVNSANAAYLILRGTGHATSGLSVANQLELQQAAPAPTLYNNLGAYDHIWGRNNVEVMRLLNGTLNLGLAGVASGALGLRGSTSGTYTFTINATAVQLTLGGSLLVAGGNISASTGTVSDSKGDLREIPSLSKSVDYTTVAGDLGRQLLHPAADANVRTFTIDSNLYNVGAALTFVNETAQALLIAITASNTLTLANSTTSGTRSLAQNGFATAFKITASKWLISGPGLS